MDHKWNEIADFIRAVRHGSSDPLWSGALIGVEDLTEHIAGGALAHVLFGWTSMHDLCIQQTDAPPFSGPYLRISPLATGMVEFRYEDTPIPEQQWTRVVAPDRVIERFGAFLEQLRWVGRMSA